MRNAVNKIAALGVATAIAPTAFAGPVGTRAAQLEQSFAGSVIDVQWRRGRWVAPAIAGAIIGGAIIAGSQYPYGYYDGPPPPGYYAVAEGKTGAALRQTCGQRHTVGRDQ